MPSNFKSNSANIDTPLVRQRLSDQVFERLMAMIRSGELTAGDALPSERALMDRFNVGRPAVREALQSMENKGLISISQGERSRVNKITASIAFDQINDIAKLLLSSESSNLENLKQLRRLLEVGSVQIVAERCTPDDISELRTLVENQRSKLGDDQAFMQADIAFHVALARHTGNPLIHSVTQAMLSWLFEYYKPLLLWDGREKTTLLEHTRIVDFLEIHDVAESAKMMSDHVDRSDPLYHSE